MRFKTVLKAGLIAGTLDLLAGIIMYVIETGKTPTLVLRFVASGIFGTAAFSGGKIMILCGLLFHFAIALLFALVFFLVAPKISFLVRNKFVTAIVCGLFVWLVMNFAVVPLSKAEPSEISMARAIPGVLTLIICIGVPFAFMLPHLENDPRRQDVYSGSIS